MEGFAHVTCGTKITAVILVLYVVMTLFLNVYFVRVHI